MSDAREGRGWGWGRLVPPSTWLIPDDIKRPTAVPTTNLFIAILASEKVGNDVVEAVGELIAEEARFNVWYATVVNGRVSPEEQAAVHARSRDIVQRVYEPWAEYLRGCAAEQLENEHAVDYVSRADREYEAVLDALQVVRQDLIEIRGNVGGGL